MLLRFWNRVLQKSEIPSTSEGRSEQTDQQHTQDYHNITIGGNARVIVGNNYDQTKSFLDPAQAQHSSEHQAFSQNGKRSDARAIGKALPVLVLEEYGHLCQTVDRLQSDDRGNHVRSYARSMSVWHAIFRQSMHDLLIPFQGAEVAQQMLSDSEHPKWSSDDLGTYLDTRFGTHARHLVSTLEPVASTLTSFDANWSSSQNNFFEAPPRPILAHSCTPSLSEHIEALKQSTDRLRQLMQQSAPQSKQRRKPTPSARSRVKVNRYVRVQDAAENLYRTFGLACSGRVEHQVHLMLQAISENPSQVMFKLVLAKSDTGPLTTSRSLLRLAIESQLTPAPMTFHNFSDSADLISAPGSRKRRQVEFEGDGVAISAQPLIQQYLESYTDSDTGQSQADGNDDSEIPASRKQKKTDSFAGVKIHQDSSVAPQVDVLPNFCNNGDFCEHIDSAKFRDVQKGHALGYLASREFAKHLIYLDRTIQQMEAEPISRTCKSLMTLNMLFKQADLTQSEIASISKQLAIAALQYHATPWLETWDGDHILFANRSSSPLRLALEVGSFESYLSVSIQKPGENNGTPIASRSKTLIPNWTLFRLGVMLLELAYQRPLRDMREPDDHYPNERDTDFFTARRLCHSVSKKMGIRFAKVVRQCISCDFGYGEDFSEVDLQAAYNESVIEELDSIETGLKNMGL